MIAFCGLTCTEYPAFIATQKDDDKERGKVAEVWSKEFNSEIKPEDINCDGCLVESDRLFSHCEHYDFVKHFLNTSDVLIDNL